MHVEHPIPYCVYNRLPEDEPSGSKHVEDKKNIKLEYLEKEHFVGLYCIIQRTVQ